MRAIWRIWKIDKPNYEFVEVDICDFDAFYKLVQDEHVDGIIHLAVENHVDRSIKDPFTFARTNLMGTLTLFQAVKICWKFFQRNMRANASIIYLPMRCMAL
jgi:dTDP-D-glucose 4,6-dehydratase